MEQHKRRKRYSGKYPKNYNEKYKELNPDKYQDVIEKVIKKGNTPVGMHIPIMTKEIIEFFNIKENEIGIDATLGFGGHTKLMLEKLNHTGHIYAFDIDEIEIVKTKKRLELLGYDEKDITIINANFKDIDIMLSKNIKCDFLLADLGISSMQVDNPERGFSYKHEGPLDLRLDPLKGEKASDLLMKMSKKELENIFIEYADEEYADIIATKICEKKSYTVIDTTLKLYQIIKEALSFIPKERRDETIKKSSQRVFQALRIYTNNELEVLDEFLMKLPNILNHGAKVVILSFHSGEDRIVKKAFKEYLNDGIFKEISNGVIRPSLEEIYNNPRCKSTKLRWAIMK